MDLRATFIRRSVDHLGRRVGGEFDQRLLDRHRDLTEVGTRRAWNPSTVDGGATIWGPGAGIALPVLASTSKTIVVLPTEFCRPERARTQRPRALR